MKFRPRFSLRTLFVLIALLSVLLGWVGWQRHLVLSRLARIQSIGDRGGLVGRDSLMKQPVRLPLYRKLLGDDSVFFIYLPPNYSEAELPEIKAMFPEVKLIADRDGNTLFFNEKLRL